MDTEVKLLPGEVKSYIESDIFFVSPSVPNEVLPGILTVTNFRLHFVGADVQIDIPLGQIAKVDKIGGVTSRKEHGYRIEILLKCDTRNLIFALNPANHGRRTMFNRLKTYAFPLNCKRKVFAFSNLETFEVNGWKVFDPVAEYKRILVRSFHFFEKLSINILLFQGPNDKNWTITDINESYHFCDTYPRVLVVPSEDLVSRAVLKSVAAFRSRNRLPVLVWRHAESGATICRSSQPLMGVKNKRSSDDEFYLSVLAKSNPGNPRLAIMDARPKANAIANRTRNGGYETEDAYRMADLHFLNIHSIHVMRESWNKLKDGILCGAVEGEASPWVKHIRRILQGAWHIVDRIERQMSVLVHCSDGWDRTSQLTSLSMLILDSYYRTLIGFEVLIEKEWLSFGHKFQTRIGHGDHHHSDSERSPVFMQFIDCVWQLMTQYTTAFEFTDQLLLTIVEHLFSCRFGTFLCNSERDRQQHQLTEKTVSLWSFINSTADAYKNPSYIEHKEILRPNVGSSVQLWTQFYCRWSKQRETTKDISQSIRFVNQSNDVEGRLVSLTSPI